jgi:hypothetical protein
MAIGTHGRESVTIAEGVELVAATADCASCNVIFLLCRILLSGPETLLELSANCDEASLGDITEWVGIGSCRRCYCVLSGRLYWRLDAYGRDIDATRSVTQIHGVIENCAVNGRPRPRRRSIWLGSSFPSSHIDVPE